MSEVGPGQAAWGLARQVVAMVLAVACAGSVLTICRWRAPAAFYVFGGRSFAWSYMWTLVLLALVLFAVTAWVARGVLAGLALVGGATVALSLVVLVDAFWLAFQVLSGQTAGSVLGFAKGYAVTLGVGLLTTVAATMLERRRHGPKTASELSAEPDTLDP